MKTYGIDLVEGSEITNLTVPTGTAFPGNPNDGELFFRTDTGGLHIYGSSSWNPLPIEFAAGAANVPAGNISATDVQSAINELDSEKVGIALDNTLTGSNTFQSTYTYLEDTSPVLVFNDTSEVADSRKIGISVSAGMWRVVNLADDNTVQANGIQYTRSTRNVEISGGNIIMGAAGKGIDFDVAGSGTDNLLDDYEEGTFTPTITGVTVAGTPTYTTQDGRYTKIGTSVTFTLHLQISAKGGMDGAIRLGGLPFGGWSGHHHPVAVGVCSNVGITAGYSLTAYVVNDEIALRLWDSANGNTNLLDTELDATFNIYVGGSYQTSD